MAGKSIPMGRTRKSSDPWLTIKQEDWTWKVLKAYNEHPEAVFARWMCAVSSPFTGGSEEYGDTYISDVVAGGGVIVQRDPEVPDSAIPEELLARTEPLPRRHR